MSSNVVSLNLPDGELAPAIDAHQVADWLRDFADQFDRGDMVDVDFIQLIALRRDTGMPIQHGRSIGRRLTNLEWGGVLAYLQHENSMSYYGEE